MNDSTKGLTSSERVGSAILSRAAPRRGYGPRSAAPASARPSDAPGPSGRSRHARSASRPARALRTLAVFLVALAAPPAASAQTEVWSATLTAGSSSDGYATGYFIDEGVIQFGSLSDDNFDVAGTSYSIGTLSINVIQAISLNDLQILIEPTLGDLAQHLTLHLGSDSFALADATLKQSFTFAWTGHGLSWSDNDTIAARLTLRTVPDAPTNLTAEAGDQQVTLNWTAPASNGGAPITDYEYEQNGSGTWTSTGGTATDYTVFSLTNGQPYTFKVRAVNRVGAGAASAASPSVTPAREPDAPTGLSATVDDQQVALNWTAPALNGGATILRYEYEQDFSGTWTSTGSAATNYTVMGLTNGQSYTFRVRAVNRVGAGAASGSRSATPTGTAAAPDAPHSLNTTPGNRQVRLSWTQPSGGTAVTRYEYELDLSETWTSTGSTATNYTVRNLMNGQSYTFRVRAANSDGASGASNSQATTPTATEPDAPQNLRSTRGDEKVTLRWTAPASDGGEPITDYEYEQDSSGTWTSTGSAATSYAVTGLNNGQTYTFRVWAVNSIGASGASNQTTATPAEVTTPPPPSVNPPSPPRGLTATAGDRAVQLSWRRPAEDGGARIVRYEYRQQEGDGPVGEWQIIGEDRPTTDHQVTELMNGTSYTFHVRAVNNGGWASPPSESASATSTATPVPAVPPIGLLVLALLLGAGRFVTGYRRPQR